MRGYLVDTNVPSELTRLRPSPKLEDFLRQAGKHTVHMSVLSVGEIRKGIATMPDSNRRKALAQWLDNEIRPWFGDRIPPVTVGVAERWGVLAGNARRLGRAAAVID